MQGQEKSQTFVFFGIVGSGKGTQVKLLMDYLKAKDGRECVYAYPGAMYRELVESDSFTAKLVKDSLNRGELQPDFLTNAIFADMLIPSLSPEKHLIADGYPRTVAQSENFEKMMEYYQRNDIKIVYITLSREEAKRRNLLRGRQDDTEEGLARRFQEYEQNVVPAMNYLESKPQYHVFQINGEQSIEDVHKDIIKALGI